ncbi:hypothetical protein GA0074695_0565 [Micromonospora viridifaciens]|uniref:EcsC protein family protein n=1 Tax=Micromonospora viridifaciens TaxID=1881 RepID=A0A1C4UJT6_MICVI|nr:hypothetical protein [Micromonospora viridifaciens]SCE71953.1 hypothetical protein GA0074695_0565 [Micromonospora viridifaciens]
MLFQPPDPAAAAPPASVAGQAQDQPAQGHPAQDHPAAAGPEPPAGAPKKTTPKKAATRKKAAPEQATPARKAAGVRKTTPARKTAAGPEPESERPQVTAATAEQESGRTPGASWRAVAARMADHPGFAPELLALAAVDALGSGARDRVEQLRRTYPGADADGLARLVTRRFVRLAGTGGAFAAGAGLLAPLAELAAVLWTQASLVLHLATVYDRDPGHPDRAAELLVLTQVHPDTGTARAALDAARSAGEPADGEADGPWPRAAEAAWRLATPLAAQAGGWLALRVASRLLPGAALLAAAAGGSAAANRLAARAVTLYRPAGPRLGRPEVPVGAVTGQSQLNQALGSSA